MKARTEWEAWQAVCRALQDAGAVTADDLTSRISARDTPGQRLLELIREWGKTLEDLRVAR